MANNMMQFIQITPFLRSLCFGGLLGVAAAIALCFYFNQTQYIPYAAIFGGSFGAAIQRGIMCVFTTIINFVGYYAKLIQIEFLGRHRIIDETTCNEIKRHNTLSYFNVKDSGDNYDARPDESGHVQNDAGNFIQNARCAPGSRNFISPKSSAEQID